MGQKGLVATGAEGYMAPVHLDWADSQLWLGEMWRLDQRRQMLEYELGQTKENMRFMVAEPERALAAIRGAHRKVRAHGGD